MARGVWAQGETSRYQLAVEWTVQAFGRHDWFASFQRCYSVAVLRVALWCLGGLGGILVAIVGGSLVWFAVANRPKRPNDGGFEYVWVDDDGSARELTPNEREYLSTEFHGADSGRPYIKLWYERRTPDNRLSGYLRRRQLPARIPIRPK